MLTSTRLLYFTDSSMRQLKGCFILASLIHHQLTVEFTPPEIWYDLSYSKFHSLYELTVIAY